MAGRSRSRRQGRRYALVAPPGSAVSLAAAVIAARCGLDLEVRPSHPDGGPGEEEEEEEEDGGGEEGGGAMGSSARALLLLSRHSPTGRGPLLLQVGRGGGDEGGGPEEEEEEEEEAAAAEPPSPVVLAFGSTMAVLKSLLRLDVAAGGGSGGALGGATPAEEGCVWSWTDHAVREVGLPAEVWRRSLHRQRMAGAGGTGGGTAAASSNPDPAGARAVADLRAALEGLERHLRSSAVSSPVSSSVPSSSVPSPPGSPSPCPPYLAGPAATVADLVLASVLAVPARDGTGCLVPPVPDPGPGKEHHPGEEKEQEQEQVRELRRLLGPFPEVREWARRCWHQEGLGRAEELAGGGGGWRRLWGGEEMGET